MRVEITAIGILGLLLVVGVLAYWLYNKLLGYRIRFGEVALKVPLDHVQLNPPVRLQVLTDFTLTDNNEIQKDKVIQCFGKNWELKLAFSGVPGKPRLYHIRALDQSGNPIWKDYAIELELPGKPSAVPPTSEKYKAFWVPARTFGVVRNINQRQSKRIEGGTSVEMTCTADGDYYASIRFKRCYARYDADYDQSQLICGNLIVSPNYLWYPIENAGIKYRGKLIVNPGLCYPAGHAGDLLIDVPKRQAYYRKKGTKVLHPTDVGLDVDRAKANFFTAYKYFRTAFSWDEVPGAGGLQK
jgi:hypothetical protein